MVTIGTLCYHAGCKAYMISDKNQGKILISYRDSVEPEKLKKSRAGREGG
jgi:hypothetical protein